MRLRQYWIQGLKLLFLRPKRFCRCKKKQFLADAQPFSKYEESVNNNNEASSWIDRLFKKAKNSHLQDEIKTYLAEPVIPKNSDPLLYWKERRDTFPSLSRMATKYFSVCATSTPSERAFSDGRSHTH